MREFVIDSARQTGRTRIAKEVIRRTPLDRTTIYIGWNQQEADRVRRELGFDQRHHTRHFFSGRSSSVGHQLVGRRYDVLILDGRLEDARVLLDPRRGGALHSGNPDALVVLLIDADELPDNRLAVFNRNLDHLALEVGGELAKAMGLPPREDDVEAVVRMLLDPANRGTGFQRVLPP